MADPTKPKEMKMKDWRDKIGFLLYPFKYLQLLEATHSNADSNTKFPPACPSQLCLPQIPPLHIPLVHYNIRMILCRLIIQKFLLFLPVLCLSSDRVGSYVS